MRRCICALVLLLAAGALSSGCALYYRGGIKLYYREAGIPAARVLRGIPYAGPSSGPKQRLNLFLPEPGISGWPVVIFIHGGNWDEGDRDLEVAGADVYNNVGRYLAARGIGAAVVSYRLLPEVDWQTQMTDIAAAAKWVASNITARGGDGCCVFLMGHSAGAQMAARAALQPDVLGGTPTVCGAIAVSGAGYDLADARTYELGGEPEYYRRRFGTSADWQKSASPIRFVRGDAPPFLILYAGGETKALQRQSQLLHERLTTAGGRSTVVVVPGESHSRIVLTLSRDGKTAGPAIVEFVNKQHSTSRIR